VISTATSDPADKHDKLESAFRALGAGNVQYLHHEQPEDGEARTTLEALDRADGVFFTGGGQVRLVTTLAGTSFESRLRERHGQGLPVGGTSAGAAALSALMIASGDGLRAPRPLSVQLLPGFGLLPGVIVDQHFSERCRFGRLLTAVLQNPTMLGFGVDEITAFLLDAHDRVSVIGEGTLTIVDAAELRGTQLAEGAWDEPIPFADMRVHVLAEGWSFDLARRLVEPPGAARSL
jgi:cyanophycinase